VRSFKKLFCLLSGTKMKKLFTAIFFLSFLSGASLLFWEIKKSDLLTSFSFADFQRQQARQAELNLAAKRVAEKIALTKLQLGRTAEATTELNSLISFLDNSLTKNKLTEIVEYVAGFERRYLSTSAQVIDDNVKAFTQYVSSNNWKKLSAAAWRLKKQSENPIANKTAIKDILEEVTSITKESTLSAASLEKVHAMKEEIANSLDKLIRKQIDLQSLSVSLAPLLSSAQQILEKQSAIIAQQNSKAQGTINRALVYLAILISSPFLYLLFLALHSLGGHFLHKSSPQAAKQKIKMDQIIFEALNNEAEFGNVELASEFDRNFHDDLQRYRKFVHQKATLGEIFSSTIPFPTLVLNSSQEIVWANDQLYGLWKKRKGEKLSWGTLAKESDLYDTNTVIDFKKKGVYTIRLQGKSEKNDDIQCEMYLSPAKQNGEELSLMFFYRVTTDFELVEEVKTKIEHHVTNILNLISNISINKPSREKIRGDFEACGLSDLYEKFISLHDVYGQQKLGLMNEINRLEDQLEERVSRQKAQEAELLALKQVIHSTEANLVSVKENALLLNVVRYQWNEICNQNIDKYKQVLAEKERLIRDAERMEEILFENQNVFRLVMWIKDDFDKLGQKFSAIHNKLNDVIKGGRKTLDVEGLTYLQHEFEKSHSLYALALNNFETSLAKLKISSNTENIDFGDMRIRLEQNREDLVSIENAQRKLITQGVEKETHLTSKIDLAVAGMHKFMASSSNGRTEGEESVVKKNIDSAKADVFSEA